MSAKHGEKGMSANPAPDNAVPPPRPSDSVGSSEKAWTARLATAARALSYVLADTEVRAEVLASRGTPSEPKPYNWEYVEREQARQLKRLLELREELDRVLAERPGGVFTEADARSLFGSVMGYKRHAETTQQEEQRA